jgi:hypothetical protein
MFYILELDVSTLPFAAVATTSCITSSSKDMQWWPPPNYIRIARLVILSYTQGQSYRYPHDMKEKKLLEEKDTKETQRPKQTRIQRLYQNLNSGSLRMNGLNSSLPLVGNAGPSLSGSTCGDRNPMSKLSR